MTRATVASVVALATVSAAASPQDSGAIPSWISPMN
jgi:hypothetical protein